MRPSGAMRLSTPLAIASLALALAAAGCGSSARFQVVRPALLDASPFGNTFTVSAFGGRYPDASYEVQRLLQQHITTSLNPSIRLLGQGGGVFVTGEVLAYDYGEQMSRDARTCTRTQRYQDAQGRWQTRNENYACTQYTRTGSARVVVRFVVQIASTGQWVYDQTYEDSDSVVTSATDQEPARIDPRAMLSNLDAGLVAGMARRIKPWEESVFTDCAGAEGCDAAFRRVQASDLFGAEQIYTQILGPYSEPIAVPEDDADIVSQTLYNRGVVRAYSGSYELALADLQRACDMRPDRPEWRDMLAEVERTAEESDRLRQQIEGAAPALEGYAPAQ